MRPRNGNPTPFSLHPSADLIQALDLSTGPPALPLGFRSDSTDRPAFTTDTGVVSRGLTGDEGRGPCSIGGTINRTSYLARLSNFCLFRPELLPPLRGRGGGGEGLEDVAAKGFDNDF